MLLLFCYEAVIPDVLLGHIGKNDALHLDGKLF